MDESAATPDRPRAFSNYWTVLCAVLFVVILGYAVFTAA
jgi:hypothetical protein